MSSKIMLNKKKICCFNCHEEGHMSRDCLNSGSGGGGDKGCYNCGELGHMIRECPTKNTGGGGGNKGCFNCGETGHMSRYCPTKNSGDSGNKSCFHCGESGHMSRECPTKQGGGGGSGSKCCFKCKEEGHMARDCPNDVGEDDTSRKKTAKKRPSEMSSKIMHNKKKNYTSSQIQKTAKGIPSQRSIKNLRIKKKIAIAKIHRTQAILGQTKPPDKKEKELQSLVFGYDSDDLEEHGQLELATEKPSKVQKEPAWEDDDDQHILVEEIAKDLIKCHRSISLRGSESYSAYVEEKFKKLMGAPKWAEMNNSDEENSDEESADELLQKVGNETTTSASLSKGRLSIKRCPALSDKNFKGGIIKSVEFHPSSRVALAAGTSGIVNLFQIDGKMNAKIQSVRFERFPINAAHFTVDGCQIIAGSRMFRYFYTYDMIAGKVIRVPMEKGMDQENVRKFHMSPDGKYIVIYGCFGYIHLVTTNTKEWVGSLKMNGKVIAVTFNKDGSKMYSHGDAGEIYVWDMSTRRCVHKFFDEGCFTGTSLALSPNDQFLVSGSDSGVVNVYDNNEVLKSNSPKPLKAIMNLTTEISNMKFNHTSELLAVSSNCKLCAVKMVHFPSLTVYSNFPTEQDSSIKYAHSLDISLNSGYFGIGNNIGTTYVYRLNRFKNY